MSYPAAVYRLSDLNFLNADEKASLLEKSELAARLLRAMDDFDDCDEEGKASGAESRTGNSSARSSGSPSRPIAARRFFRAGWGPK